MPTNSQFNIDPAEIQAQPFEPSCLAGAFLTLFLLVATPAQAQVFYTVSLNPDTLVSYDIRSGAASTIGTVGNGGAFIVGLAYDPAIDQLLGVGEDNYLYDINRFTGASTRVGPLQISIAAPGLDFDPNTRTLYLTSTSWYTTSLYKVNLSTGAAT